MCVSIADVNKLIKQYHDITPLTLEELADHFTKTPFLPVTLHRGQEETSVILDKENEGYCRFRDCNKVKKESLKDKRTVWLLPKKESDLGCITLPKHKYLKSWYVTKIS
jgi:hypothetical protein